MTIAEILALLAPDSPDTWPQGILAAADLREQRAKAFDSEITVRVAHEAIAGVLLIEYEDEPGEDPKQWQIDQAWGAADSVLRKLSEDIPVHIAAEANPDHLFAAVRRWRGVVGRHKHDGNSCRYDAAPWSCMDIRETADEARTYCGGGE